MSHPNDKTIKAKPSKIVPIRNFKLKSIKASAVKIEPQRWLLNGYIPLNECTLIAGTGGIGKSTLLLYFASLVSNGAKLTLNSIDCIIEQGKVLILSAEDRIKTSIVPRLKSINANLDNIEIIESVFEIEEPEDEFCISLDKDLYLIEQKIKEMENVRLIIIDPVTAYIGDLKEDKSSHVRNFLIRLGKIAEKYNLSILLNTHTRKHSGNDSGGSAADEIIGSTAWKNTVRQVFTVTVDPDDKERILVHCPKSNCGPKPEAFDYTIESFNFEHNGLEIKTSRIKLLSGKVDIDADQAMNRNLYEKKLATDEAKEFILRILKFGRKSYNDILREAIDEGINEATLKVARQSLTREGIDPIVMERNSSNRTRMDWYIGISTKK
jgi:RecA-family ATPase